MDDHSLSAELERLRESRGYSQDRVARRSGVSKATLNRWERGGVQRPHSWDQVIKIARALDLLRIDANSLLHATRFPWIDQLHANGDAAERAAIEQWTVEARNNLPGTLTSLIGREIDIIRTGQLLIRDDVRLVTLTGPGGAGKTRLGIATARELHDAFPDGVFFLPLADIVDHQAVIPAIARTLGLRDVPGQSAADRLAGHLRNLRVLLVLDNAEQVIGAGPELASLLEQTRWLTMLATSRVPFRVSSEHVRQVLPFTPPDTGANRATIRENPAVRLFAERAGAVDPDFRLNGNAVAAVASICSRLEGIPLAIELAAARCRDSTPAELLQRFPERLDLGDDGERDRPDRHRSLRATIGWSYDMLVPATQAVFRRLAVFSGGWTSGAALEICSGQQTTLADLREVNLVQEDPDGRGRMLETIREFAAEQLEANGESGLYRKRHAAHFLGLVESARPYIPQQRQDEWLTAVDREYANITTLLEGSDPVIVVRLVVALWPYWHEYGRFMEGDRWLQYALSLDISERQRAELLTGHLLVSYSRGDVLQAMTSASAALDSWRRVGDQRGLALTLLYAGQTRYMASSFTPESVQQIGQYYQDSLAAWKLAGEPLGIARCLSEIAILAGTTGDVEKARSVVAEALTIYEQEGDRAGIVRSLTDLGLFAMLAGNLESAISLLNDGVRLCRQLGDNYQLGWALFYLGASLAFTGQLDAAETTLTESLHHQHELESLYGIAYTLLGFAALRHRQGRHTESATLCGAVTTVLKDSGIAMNPAVAHIYQTEQQAVSQAIGPDAFAETFVAGQSMPLTETVRFATGGHTLSRP